MALVLIGSSGCGRLGYDPLAECGPECEGSDGGVDGPDGNAAVVDGGAGADGSLLYVVGVAADTYVNSFAPTLNYGGGEFFSVRSSAVNDLVGLLRFDLGLVPDGEVSRAVLQLDTNSAALSQGEVVVYRVLEAWREGTGVGSAGATSWNERDVGLAWTAPGCGPGSRDAVELVRFAPLAGNTGYVVELPADVVQGWLDEPATNAGLALVAEGTGAGDAVGFWSRERGDGAAELQIELANAR